MIFKKRFIKEAYNQVKSEIDNYKKFMEIKKCMKQKKIKEKKK